MPGYNGMGPAGYGPMTGGGRGYCVNGYPGRGFGLGRGRWNGYRRQGALGWGQAGMRFNPIVQENNVERLEEQSEALKDELVYLEERIKDIKSSQK